jgi:hypothetical protein
MNKILAIAIGIGLVLGTVSFSFAQDTAQPKMTSKKKTPKKKAKTTGDSSTTK